MRSHLRHMFQFISVAIFVLLQPCVDSFIAHSNEHRITSSLRTGNAPDFDASTAPIHASPFPAMPSKTFIDLTQNQFELLANSVFYPTTTSQGTSTHITPASKIKSIALYLPQENTRTGALEFVPTALYPCPATERMFIASEVGSGLPPTMPKTLAALPGFANAQSLLPAYPFASTGFGEGASYAVGAVEEVMCDLTEESRGSALSVPLYSGSQTVGVVLVWPSTPPYTYKMDKTEEECFDVWTANDKEQISRAARSISMALQLDIDRNSMMSQSHDVRISLEDNLHQVKNPLQALRTYAKVLQLKIATSEEGNVADGSADDRMITPVELLALAENMMVQSERVVSLLAPMDGIVNALEEQEEKQRLLLQGTSTPPLLGPSDPPGALVARGHLSNDTAIDTVLAGGSSIKEAENNIDDSREIGRENETLDFRTRKGSGSSFSATVDAPLDVEMSFIADVLEPILAGAKAVAQDRGILFEVVGLDDEAELPGVSICPESLQEAVANVLDNAIKYIVLNRDGNENPSPQIKVSVSPNREPLKPGVTILVEDNGPGIPPDEREAVFLRGFRGDTTRLVSGSGIGLDISKSLVSRMGGMLDVVADENDETDMGMRKGTSMRFVVFR